MEETSLISASWWRISAAAAEGASPDDVPSCFGVAVGECPTEAGLSRPRWCPHERDPVAVGHVDDGVGLLAITKFADGGIGHLGSFQFTGPPGFGVENG